MGTDEEGTKFVLSLFSYFSGEKTAKKIAKNSREEKKTKTQKRRERIWKGKIVPRDKKHRTQKRQTTIFCLGKKKKKKRRRKEFSKLFSELLFR